MPHIRRYSQRNQRRSFECKTTSVKATQNRSPITYYQLQKKHPKQSGLAVEHVKKLDPTDERQILFSSTASTKQKILNSYNFHMPNNIANAFYL